MMDWGLQYLLSSPQDPNCTELLDRALEWGWKFVMG